MNEAVEAIAKLLEMTPQQLGADIWQLASTIEGQGNKGYSLDQLEKFAEREDLKVVTYMLRDPLHQDCYAGILFEAHGSGSRGRRRRFEAEGWMVRKNPHWRSVWMTLYGETQPELLAAYQQAEADRIAADEAERQRKLLRPVETSPGAAFAELSTVQVGHRYAVAHILYAQLEQRWRARRWDVPLPAEDEPKKRSRSHEVDRLDSMDAYSANVWDEQQRLMTNELKYRADVLQDEQAREILSKGTAYFYTRESFWRLVESERLPEFTNGYLGQPFDVVQPPISRLRDSDVMRQFVALLDPEGTIGGKFEEDDLQTMLGILRAQLKRLKPKQE